MKIITNSEGFCGLATAISAAKSGDKPLDCIEKAIQKVEDDPSVMTVGKGGFPNIKGVLQHDAAIMDGNNLCTGAVGCIEGIEHPISLAREVLKNSPHELLVGQGAHDFALHRGFQTTPMHTSQSQEAYHKWLMDVMLDQQEQRNHRVGKDSDHSVDSGLPSYITSPISTQVIKNYIKNNSALGTTIYLVQDEENGLAAGVSTSGWPFKHPGRLGDSPLIGAGIYADSSIGACGCVGFGELSIRTSLAVSIIRFLERGASCEESLWEGVRLLRRSHLNDDVLQLKPHLTMHVLSKDGDHSCLNVAVDTTMEASYGLWSSHASSSPIRPCPTVSLLNI